jgi:hypothetical protein
MRLLFTGLALFLVVYSFSQGADTTINLDKTPRNVSFIAKIDLQQATKDGMYLNGYVVNLPYEKAKTLNGKTVRIKGKVTIIKGNKHYTDGQIRQGRQEDSKHILKPKIKIVRD